MRASLHTAARRWWAGEAGTLGRVLSVLSAPIEWAYRGAVARRNRAYDARGGVHIEGLRVVSVGNLAVGGTGKTPIAAWVCRGLADGGARVTLVARGYGRDEILLHRRWNPDIPVLAEPDRVAAARAARERGADVVVLDDGFQHRRLARDLDIVLLAAEDPLPGRLLPRGPYREPPDALGRAQSVVVTRRTASSANAGDLARRMAEAHPGIVVAVAALIPGGWQDLSGRPASPPGGAAMAAAAVARPEAFRVHVASETGGEVELAAFPDHYDYGEADARALRTRAAGRAIVITEKDAVKLSAHAAVLGPVYVLVQALRWESGESALRASIAAAVRRTEH